MIKRGRVIVIDDEPAIVDLFMEYQTHRALESHVARARNSVGLS